MYFLYYRLTTPTSTVFVQRTFGNAPSAPVSDRTLKRQINQNYTEHLFNNNTTEDVFASLKGAVDVLTRSSQGYMSVPEKTVNDEQLENDIQEIQKEIESLQKDIEILNNADITFDLTKEENIEEVISLQQNLDNLVEGLENNAALNQEDIKKPQFQHFPVVNVENIYDKDAIETILLDFTDKNIIDNTDNTVIESKQYDDILLSNYLKNTHITNEIAPKIKPSTFNREHNEIPSSTGRQSVEVIHGKPMDRVNAPANSFPRAEKLVSIPDTVSNIMTSVNSFISYDNADRKPTKPKNNQVHYGYSKTPVSTSTQKVVDKPKNNISNVQYNHRSLPTPSTTENINVNDVAIKSNPKLTGTENDFVHYMPSPDLPSVPQIQNFKPNNKLTNGFINSNDKVELIDDQIDEVDYIQKFWPESKINATYQESWIG